MGWNSWNQYQADIDEILICETADALVASGLADAGYRYLVIDGGWREPERDSRGDMQVNSRFPGGIKAVADHVHGLGLKLGLHQAVGMRDCAGRTPGTQSAPGRSWRDKARRDLDLFCSWGVDLLKFDLCKYQFPPDCSGEDRDAAAREAYLAMGQAIAESAHPVLYSVSEYGRHQPWTWVHEAGADMWRTTGDLRVRWKGPDPAHFHKLGVLDVLDQHERLVHHTRPGCWADPDMLVAGVTTAHVMGEAPLTATQNRAHVSLWAILAAPLMLAHDLRTSDPQTIALLSNPDVIAVDQDPLGIPGHRVRRDGQAEVWARPLSGGDAAVVIFNRGDTQTTVSWTLRDAGLFDQAGTSTTMRDLWSGQTAPVHGSTSTTVAPHDAAMYRLSARQVHH